MSGLFDIIGDFFGGGPLGLERYHIHDLSWSRESPAEWTPISACFFLNPQQSLSCRPSWPRDPSQA